MNLPQIDDYRSLLLNDTPMLDVRAPVEFNQGAFPFAKNHPLINDKERKEIGIRYKNLGQDKAIELGHELVQGDVKSERVKQWQDFIEQNPQGVLYCFRGFEQTGVAYPRIKGGYKAMRHFLIDELEASTQKLSPVLLGGRTGIGKTVLLKKIKQQIDLEGIYHHRGSVFGNHVTPQPSQIDIENKLSIKLLKCRNKQYTHIVLEDEGNNIGSRAIPNTLSEKMKASPIILLEANIDERVDITFQEYIIESLTEHLAYNGKQRGFESWSNHLLTAIDKIQRRLGGDRHKELKNLLTHAIDQQKSTGETEYHKEWIKFLLVDYYDPMYDFQLTKKADRVVFKGRQNEVINYLNKQYHLS